MNYSTPSLRGIFIDRCRRIPVPRVLEIGTATSIHPIRRDWVPHAGEYLGTDSQYGTNVDFVADVHWLSSVVGVESFDVVIACFVFEHFKYPTLAAHEIMKTLRIGGLVFVETHQSFPLHYFPRDYFRFSREALASLFSSSMGFTVETDYEFPVTIRSANHQTEHLQAFENVRLFGEKIASTPDDYRYEVE